MIQYTIEDIKRMFLRFLNRNESEELKMSKGQIARMVTMLVIAVVLVLSVWGYSTELWKLANPIEYADNVYIDGADFTGPTNLVVEATNGFMEFVIMLGYFFVLFVISLVLLLPWCLVVAIKKPVIAPVEFNIAIGTYIGTVVLSLLFGLIGVHFSEVLFVVIMTLIVAIMFGLLCFLPYWMAYRRCKKAEMNYD